jgi:isopenicillin-N N-acyltransferase like protein
MASALPFFDVAGSYREIGRQVGEGARDHVTALVARYEHDFETLGGMTFAAAVELTQTTYLPAARTFGPELIDQLEGMAEGAGVPFEALFVLNCGEELTCPPDPEPEHCTSLAIVSRGRHIAAHNEDWYAGDAEHIIVVRATLPGGRRYLSATAAAYLPFTGMTSAGMACSANTLYALDFTNGGVPNQLLCASLLHCADLESVRARIAYAARGRGSNHLLLDVHDRIWDMETSASEWRMTVGEGWYVHTNHYIEPEMERFEGNTSEGSRKRLARAGELMRAGLARRADPVELAIDVLRDHQNDDLHMSICCHPDDSEPEPLREMTTASMVWDLDQRRMSVCAGPPCENTRSTFAL